MEIRVPIRFCQKLNAGFPLANDASYKIWLQLAHWVQRYSCFRDIHVSCLKVWKDTRTDARRYTRTLAQVPTYMRTLWAISSGELKSLNLRLRQHVCSVNVKLGNWYSQCAKIPLDSQFFFFFYNLFHKQKCYRSLFLMYKNHIYSLKKWKTNNDQKLLQSETKARPRNQSGNN